MNLPPSLLAPLRSGFLSVATFLEFSVWKYWLCQYSTSVHPHPPPPGHLSFCFLKMSNTLAQWGIEADVHVTSNILLLIFAEINFMKMANFRIN